MLCFNYSRVAVKIMDMIVHLQAEAEVAVWALPGVSLDAAVDLEVPVVMVDHPEDRIKMITR